MIQRISPDRLQAESRGEPILWVPNYEVREGLDWSSCTTGARRNPSGVKITPENAVQSTVVLACCRVLSEAVASLNIGVYRFGDDDVKTLDRANPLYRLIARRPNRWQTSYEWREQMMLHLCLYGNSYNQIIRGPGGVVTALIPLHPSRMIVDEVAANVIRYTYTESMGGTTTYPAEDIMHIRWMSDDGIEGMVPTVVAKDAIALARACEIHGSAYFGNGARPGVILETDNEVTPEAALLLRENWERIHKGVDRAWKTAVLTNGLKAHELGSNNQESQFLEVRRFQTEEICRIYRCPPHLVMDLQRATFSNIEQQSLDFLQYTLTPWLRRIESALCRDILLDDPEIEVSFDTRSFLRGDASSRAAYYQAMWNLGVLSVNEIRAAENMNPVEGGDSRFVQLNMTTLDKAAEEEPDVPV